MKNNSCLKVPNMFTPENELEESLVRVASDPGHRPQFYRDVLSSEIFVITMGKEHLDIEDGCLREGSSVQFQAWNRDGEDWLPIFSSLSRLNESLESESSYLQLNAKSFFEMTQGANVILNPNLDYGKDFIPSEIKSMLDGSIFTGHKRMEIQKETQVQIGQPSVYPTKLVNSLSKLFQSHSKVKAAYLAHINFPDNDEKPHTIIGIDLESDWDKIVGEAGLVAKEVLTDKEVVDFTPISHNNSGISAYLLNDTTPFYKKSSTGNNIWSWLRSKFSN